MNKITSLTKRILLKVKGNNIKIGDFILKSNRSHALSYIFYKYPEYGLSLVRVAKSVQKKYKNITIFDIGANIGDTAAMLLSDNPQYKIVCIEGDERYFKLLSKNLANVKNVVLHKVFLNDEEMSLNISFERMDGTLRFKKKISDIKNNVQFTTLDTFIKQHPEYAHVKILKIDTDGYDAKILRGAENYINETKPVLYFEYDSNYMLENRDNGLDIFDRLKNLGYHTAAFYENYGRFVISTEISAQDTLKQLDRYISKRRGAFPYYDVIVFHSSDMDIAKEFIASEVNRE